jgi:hypothetical protein
MGNKYNEHITEEIVRILLTFDQDACFESIKKQMLERINSDASKKKLESLEKYISVAETLTCFYFCDHHIPYGFYTMEFVERKYPELVQRIRKMVEELVNIKD